MQDRFTIPRSASELHSTLNAKEPAVRSGGCTRMARHRLSCPCRSAMTQSDPTAGTGIAGDQHCQLCGRSPAVSCLVPDHHERRARRARRLMQEGQH